MKTKKLQLQDIQFTIEALEEDIHPFEMLSECTSEKECDDLYSESVGSNIWKWCTVSVKGTYKGLESIDYLGACSYESEEDFVKTSGYYEDMQNTVLSDLQNQVNEIIKDLIQE